MTTTNQLHSTEEISDYLAQFVPVEVGVAYSLDRMFALMDALGNPQNQLKVIHVAGTSGKTSTSYFIATMLKNCGQKVGLSVSPHIDSVKERALINDLPLEDEKYIKYFNEFIATPSLLDLEPTYFEILVAFAYWVFAKEAVDYAVMEVGLGGLLDGTNVVSRPDKVCVITDIGLDHTQILGDTIPEIAAQKAGIIQGQNQVLMLEQPQEVIEVVRTTAKQKGAKLDICSEQADLAPDLPQYQQRNWSLAHCVVDFVANRDQFTKPDLAKLPISAWQVPARMEKRTFRGHRLVLDGAHNPSKFKALVSSLDGGNYIVVLAVITSKQSQIRECLEILKPVCAQLIVTGFEESQDYKHQAIDPQLVKQTSEELGYNNVQTTDDPTQAVELAMKSDEPILVTGSLYLIASVRRYLHD